MIFQPLSCYVVLAGLLIASNPRAETVAIEMPNAKDSRLVGRYSGPNPTKHLRRKLCFRPHCEERGLDRERWTPDLR